jgi:hypothetical protein
LTPTIHFSKFFKIYQNIQKNDMNMNMNFQFHFLPKELKEKEEEKCSS